MQLLDYNNGNRVPTWSVPRYYKQETKSVIITCKSNKYSVNFRLAVTVVTSFVYKWSTKSNVSSLCAFEWLRVD
jgi:hypothetical protein